MRDDHNGPRGPRLSVTSIQLDSLAWNLAWNCSPSRSRYDFLLFPPPPFEIDSANILLS